MRRSTPSQRLGTVQSWDLLAGKICDHQNSVILSSLPYQLDHVGAGGGVAAGSLPNHRGGSVLPEDEGRVLATQ